MRPALAPSFELVCLALSAAFVVGLLVGLALRFALAP